MLEWGLAGNCVVKSGEQWLRYIPRPIIATERKAVGRPLRKIDFRSTKSYGANNVIKASAWLTRTSTGINFDALRAVRSSKTDRAELAMRLVMFFGGTRSKNFQLKGRGTRATRPKCTYTNSSARAACWTGRVDRKSTKSWRRRKASTTRFLGQVRCGEGGSC